MTISWLKESIKAHQRDVVEFLDMLERPFVPPALFHDVLMGELQAANNKQKEGASTNGR